MRKFSEQVTQPIHNTSEVVDEEPVRLLHIGSTMHPVLTHRQQEQLQNILREIRSRPGMVPEDLFRKALHLFAGNASQTASAIGFSRQYASKLIHYYGIDVDAIRDRVRDRHVVQWKVPRALFLVMPDLAMDGVIQSFEKEAAALIEKAVQWDVRKEFHTMRCTAPEVWHALELNDGSLAGAALDLGIASPTVLYWVKKEGWHSKVRAMKRPAKRRIPWPVPDAIIRATQRVRERTTLSSSAAFARLMRGTMERMSADAARDDEVPPTIRDTPTKKSVRGKGRSHREVLSPC